MNEDRSRQRLGRGLASLIGTGTPRPVPGLQPASPPPPDRELRLGDLIPNPSNPRRNFDQEDLENLAISIRQHGIVQPLLVRPAAEGGQARFEIVAGERRWRAARKAGLQTVPVVIREIDDRQSLEIAIIENVQRSDLNAIDEAIGYERLINEHGYTQNDLGEVLGKSRSHVANTLRLLKLPEDVRAMVVSGRLAPGAARAVVTADDPAALARRIVDEGLTVREAEELAREPMDAARPATTRGVRRPAEKGAEVTDLERRLSDALGLPVEIVLKGRRGSLRVDFHNIGSIEDICGRLERR